MLNDRHTALLLARTTTPSPHQPTSTHRACAIALAAPNRQLLTASPPLHSHTPTHPHSHSPTFPFAPRKDFAIAVGNASHGNLFTYTHGNFSMDTKVETAST